VLRRAEVFAPRFAQSGEPAYEHCTQIRPTHDLRSPSVPILAGRKPMMHPRPCHGHPDALVIGEEAVGGTPGSTHRQDRPKPTSGLYAFDPMRTAQSHFNPQGNRPSACILAVTRFGKPAFGVNLN